MMSGDKRAILRACIAAAQRSLESAAHYAASESEAQNGTDVALMMAVGEAGRVLDAARAVTS